MAWICLSAFASGEEPLRAVRLGWDPSPDPDATGYVVHYGTRSRDYFLRLDVGTQTEVRLTNLVGGLRYYFAVSAYNSERLEGPLSEELAYRVPRHALPPVEIEVDAQRNGATRVRGVLRPGRQYQIEVSQDLRFWKVLHAGVSPATGRVEARDSQTARFPRRFYRLAEVPRTIPGLVTATRASGSEEANQVGFSVQAGLAFQVQSSLDLRSWTTLKEGVAGGDGWTDLSDEASADGLGRYYRLITTALPPAGLLRIEAGHPPALHGWLQPGRQYEIQASEDMIHWKPVRTGISRKDGTFRFMDREATALPQRFYRLAEVPRTLSSMLQLERPAATGIPSRVSFSVRAGQPFMLQATTDGFEWVTLLDGVSFTDDWQDFEDEESPGQPMRFYRLTHP